MATLGILDRTLVDYQKLLTPDNQVTSDIVEILTETNEVLDDLVFTEANNINSHRTTIRSGLPVAYWRSINRGVPRSKSHSVQVDDRIGMLEAWSQVDASLADLNGQRAEFMLSEERAFIETMNQEMARTVIYGDLVENTASFLGLAPRYSTLDLNKAQTAENVIDAGGVGDNLTSIWLCVWGDLTGHMIFAKGLPVGLKREYLGRMPVPDPDGNEFMGYKAHYSWNLGMTVRDWHYFVRIANIDMTELDNMIDSGAADAATQKVLRLMLKARNQVPNINLGRPAWLMNRTIRTMLDIIAAEKSNVNLTIESFEGRKRKITAFSGIPIRQVDALGQEARVTA